MDGWNFKIIFTFDSSVNLLLKLHPQVARCITWSVWPDLSAPSFISFLVLSRTLLLTSGVAAPYLLPCFPLCKAQIEHGAFKWLWPFSASRGSDVKMGLEQRPCEREMLP